MNHCLEDPSLCGCWRPAPAATGLSCQRGQGLRGAEGLLQKRFAGCTRLLKGDFLHLFTCQVPDVTFKYFFFLTFDKNIRKKHGDGCVCPWFFCPRDLNLSSLQFAFVACWWRYGMIRGYSTSTLFSQLDPIFKQVGICSEHYPASGCCLFAGKEAAVWTFMELLF